MGVMFYVWIMIMVIAIIIEISTTDLTSLWFAVGAIAALISNLFLHDDLIYVQILIFAIVAIVSIFVLRPLFKKRMNIPTTATNADAMIGKLVLVTSTIEVNHPGSVKVEGVEWTANTEKDKFEPGEFVEVVSISGNTLLVSKNEKKEGE